jgi:hypothetical protein
MGRHAPKIQVLPDDRAALERWCRSKTVRAYPHERAIMIMESALGIPVKDIFGNTIIC